MTTASQDSYPAYSNEIDLFQLCADLWRKRALIMICTFAFLVCGVIYVYKAPVVYEAKAYLLPPPESSIIHLKIADPSSLYKKYSLPEISKGEVVDFKQEVFDMTNQYLMSDDIKKALLNTPAIVKFMDDNPSNVIQLNMSVVLPDVKKNKKGTTVYIRWNNPDEAAEMVNIWVKLAMQGAKDELVRNAKMILQEQMRRLDSQIAAKKKATERQIENELYRLEEAKLIAEELEISDPIDIATKGLVIDSFQTVNVMSLRSLYLLGSRALSAEIDVLKRRRENAENYMAESIVLEEQRIALRQTTLEPDLVRTAKVNLRAVPPVASIKPKRKLIILLSLVLGIMVGIFVALIAESVEKRKLA